VEIDQLRAPRAPLIAESLLEVNAGTCMARFVSVASTHRASHWFRTLARPLSIKAADV